jgi:hypothetical protein
MDGLSRKYPQTFAGVERIALQQASPSGSRSVGQAHVRTQHRPSIAVLNHKQTVHEAEILFESRRILYLKADSWCKNMLSTAPNVGGLIRSKGGLALR